MTGHDLIVETLERGWDALEEGDVGAAVGALESARSAAPDDPAVLELAAALARETGDDGAELAVYERWRSASPDDGAPWIEAAGLLLDAGDAKGARLLLEGFLERHSPDPADEADARYDLGFALADLGDQEGAVAEWLRVRDLDARGDPPQTVLSADEFVRLADDALAELPQRLLEQLGAVPIVVDDRPSADTVRDGVDPRILGLFVGVPLTGQSVLGAPAGGVIQLYQRNLEAATGDPDELAAQIRITVLHETAHFVGLDEADLRRLGLD